MTDLTPLPKIVGNWPFLFHARKLFFFFNCFWEKILKVSPQYNVLMGNKCQSWFFCNVNIVLCVGHGFHRVRIFLGGGLGVVLRYGRPPNFSLTKSPVLKPAHPAASPEIRCPLPHRRRHPFDSPLRRNKTHEGCFSHRIPPGVEQP